MALQAIILAAGKGTRMESDLPKVLHTVKGKSMLEHVLLAVRPLVQRPVVVVGYGRELVESHVGDTCHVAVQEEQLGTGHAVASARALLERDNPEQVLVLAGDMPFVSTDSLRRIRAIHAASTSPLLVATTEVPVFTGLYEGLEAYGRIVRTRDGSLERIVEKKDATSDERTILEVNAGVYCFTTSWLLEALTKLKSENASHEYYITDTIALAYAEGYRPETTTLIHPNEALGANTPEDLQRLETLQRN